LPSGLKKHKLITVFCSSPGHALTKACQALVWHTKRNRVQPATAGCTGKTVSVTVELVVTESTAAAAAVVVVVLVDEVAAGGLAARLGGVMVEVSGAAVAADDAVPRLISFSRRLNAAISKLNTCTTMYSNISSSNSLTTGRL